MTDQEREDYITACGKRFLKAHAAGDEETARLWLTAQNAAVKERSAAQVAKLEGERGLSQCYFCAEGEKAREAAQERSIGNA